MAAKTQTTYTFPWARSLTADQLSAFVEDLWGAAGDSDGRAALDAIERTITRYRPETVPCPLSPRELHVLTLIANGRTYRVAARELGLATETVRSQCSTMYARIGARSGAHAAAIATHHGWLPRLDIPQPAPPVPQLRPVEWRQIYRDSAAAMRKRPGTVVPIGPFASRLGAGNALRRIRDGKGAFQPAGCFHAERVRTTHGQWMVHARYLGAPSTNDERAAS